MRRFLHILSCAALLAALPVGCVFKNTLDYPLVDGQIVSFSVEGQKEVTINPLTRTVTVLLEEDADITALPLKTLELSEGGRLRERLDETLDLSEPLVVTVRTWQDYTWTIRAEQPVERYVRCTGQIGEARFNLETYTVYVNVPDTQPLSSIEVLEMKLDPVGMDLVSTTGFALEGGRYIERTEACIFPMCLDCVLGRTFLSEGNGKSRVWKFTVIQIKTTVSIVSVKPACYSAQVRALFSGTGDPVLEYRRSADADWTRFTDFTVSGVGVSAKLGNLAPDTDYQVRIVNGDEASEPFSFHTGPDTQLDNMGFDNWYLKDTKIWYPYLEDGLKVWDSANRATASFTGSTTVPVESPLAVAGPGKKAARLTSEYAVVKFAAGNIFTGSFIRVKGLGAELSWGIPFTARPVSLQGWCRYEPATVNYADAAYADLKGRPDQGHIIVILTDWDEPFLVASSEKKFVDFDNDPAIIGYGKYICDATQGEGYDAFDLTIQYRSDRTPKWVVVVASSSALGDYFTGGTGSTLYLDEFRFHYE